MAFKKVWFKCDDLQAYIYVNHERIADFKTKMWKKILKFDKRTWEIDRIDEEIYENPEDEVERFIIQQ